MPMTPTPAASGKGEGPLLWGEGSPLSHRGSSSRVLPLPPSSSPALTSLLFLLRGLPDSLPALTCFPSPPQLGAYLSFLYPRRPLVPVGGWLQDRVQGGNHFLWGEQRGRPRGSKEQGWGIRLAWDLTRNASAQPHPLGSESWRTRGK